MATTKKPSTKHLDIATLKPKKPTDIGVDYDAVTDFARIIKKHHGRTGAEQKYDGYGVLFSTVRGPAMASLDNNLWDVQAVPELHADFKRLPAMVAVGELVGANTGEGFTHYDAFKAADSRTLAKANPDQVRELMRTMPLEMRLYDILELRGKRVDSLPLLERRAILLGALNKTASVLPVDQRITEDPEELREWTLKAFQDNLEGFVVKDLTTPYVLGSRSMDWLKLKDKLSFDVLVIGLYQTPEQKAAGFPFSNFLGGVINETTGRIETLTKVTVNDKALAQKMYKALKPALENTWSAKKPYYWQNTPESEVHKDPSVVYNGLMTARGGKMLRKAPFLYVRNPLKNSFVAEVKCLDVSTGNDTWTSCGLTEGDRAYTLRQATYSRTRDDKSTRQATTTSQILVYRKGLDA